MYEITDLPRSIRLPIALMCLALGIAAICGAGAAFLKLELPAAAAGDYQIATAAVLGLIAATVGTPVMAKNVNDWLLRQIAKVW